MPRRTAVLGRSVSRVAALATPRTDVFMPPTRGLPVRTTSAAGTAKPTWLFVAAHGGAGASLLAQLSWPPDDAAVNALQPSGIPAPWPAYGISAGRAWPNPQLEPTGLVVVVCRTTMHGLAWARDVAAGYLSGLAPDGLHLLGAVTVADQPGRLPAPLAAAHGLLAGAYAHTWHVPYVPEYRLLTRLPGEACPPLHPAVADVLTAIRTAAAPATPNGATP